MMKHFVILIAIILSWVWSVFNILYGFKSPVNCSTLVISDINGFKIFLFIVVTIGWGFWLVKWCLHFKRKK